MHVNQNSRAPRHHFSLEGVILPLSMGYFIFASSLTGFDCTSTVFLIVTWKIINMENHEQEKLLKVTIAELLPDTQK